MSDHDQGPIIPVICRRLNRELRVEEHLGCAYCNGKRAEVEAGKREVFCDFQPGLDPINFGFPEGTTRMDKG